MTNWAHFIFQKMFLSRFLPFFIFARVSISQIARKWDYRPKQLEDCSNSDQLQDCHSKCVKSGRQFCNFKWPNGRNKYAGCLIVEYFWYCCNNLTDNHEECVGKLDRKGPCDAENAGEWLYVANTRGHVTCRKSFDTLTYENENSKPDC